MQNFDAYTPEMLVYYNSLAPQLQDALRDSGLPIEDMESLAAAAEAMAQCGAQDETP